MLNDSERGSNSHCCLDEFISMHRPLISSLTLVGDQFANAKRTDMQERNEVYNWSIRFEIRFNDQDVSMSSRVENDSRLRRLNHLQ